MLRTVILDHVTITAGALPGEYAVRHVVPHYEQARTWFKEARADEWEIIEEKLTKDKLVAIIEAFTKEREHRHLPEAPATRPRPCYRAFSGGPGRLACALSGRSSDVQHVHD